MKRTVIDCDVCTAEGMAEEFAVTTASYLDAAGDGDTHEETVDLCPACIRKGLRQAFDVMTMAERRRWFESLTGRKVERT